MITIQDALEILENCPIKSGIVYIPFEVKNAVAEVLRRVVSGELVEVVHAHWIEMDDDCSNLWNTTVKKSDIDKYGWEANPFVWVISFERCKKPKDEN